MEGPTEAEMRRDQVVRLKYENARLQSENAKLREALDRIADTPMKWTKPQGDVYWANISRNQALEEAAKVAEGYHAAQGTCQLIRRMSAIGGKAIAAAIRALKVSATS